MDVPSTRHLGHIAHMSCLLAKLLMSIFILQHVHRFCLPDIPSLLCVYIRRVALNRTQRIMLLLLSTTDPHPFLPTTAGA